ncbi:response regulator transcription factor [Flammeovirgaceae bacterium SG7u.111]|nr:response regulator transcription factor [Flammeovirgaceae bacterium SG7u.132]WPO33421.1 response regulator transcription factor [Flammeovirgaceae bacterium SG7u.111]
MDIKRVVLADDHEIIRNGIKMILQSSEDIEVVGEASDGLEALQKVEELKPHVLVVDIRMPNQNGIETAAIMRDKFPDTKVLILSMHDDEEYIIKSVECGASGYLLKDTNQTEFIKAVRSVYNGEKYFSGDISSVIVNHYLNATKGGNAATATTTRPSAASAPVADNYDLTKREKQILSLLYRGENNKQIADRFNKSIRTIETHRFNIMKKMKVNNVIDLIKKVDEEPSLKKLIEVEPV